jgi:hypothetical protein
MHSTFAITLGILVLVPIWETVILMLADSRGRCALAAAGPKHGFPPMFPGNPPTISLFSILERKCDTWGHVLQRSRGLCERLFFDWQIGGGS